MWYWYWLRNKLWDWLRPWWYRNRPRTTLNVHSSTLGVGSKPKE